MRTTDGDIATYIIDRLPPIDIEKAQRIAATVTPGPTHEDTTRAARAAIRTYLSAPWRTADTERFTGDSATVLELPRPRHRRRRAAAA